MRRRWRALLLVAPVLFGACGIGIEHEPVTLEGSRLPIDAVPDEPDAGTDGGSLVYLVAGDRLQPVPRSKQPSVLATIDVLLDGPRAAEVEAGLRSAIPAGTTVLAVRREGGVTRVDLSESFTTIVGEEALLALAQLVFTVSAAAATSSDGVAFSIEGEPVPVALEDGEVTSEPVRPEDYDDLLGG